MSKLMAFLAPKPLFNKVLGRKITRISVCNYLFLENGPFLCPFKVTKHYINRGFQGETQNVTFGCKSPIFGRGLERGFTICDTWKLCSAENTIFIVFSAEHCFVDMKECNLKKNTKNRGLFAKMQKVVFLVCFFGCLVFFIPVSLCFWYVIFFRPKRAILLQF